MDQGLTQAPTPSAFPVCLVARRGAYGSREMFGHNIELLAAHRHTTLGCAE